MEPIFTILLVMVGLAVFLGIINSANIVFLDTFKKYSSLPSKTQTNTIDFLEGIKRLEKLDFNIARTKGKLADCYVPSKKIIALSDDTFNNRSVASLSVVAHEVGHSLQHKYHPISFNLVRIIKAISSVLGSFVIPAILTSFIIMLLGFNETIAWGILYIAIGIAACDLLAKMLTIPMEYGASRIAINLLRKYQILDEEELNITQKITNAAAFTYIADFIKDITGLNLFKKRR